MHKSWWMTWYGGGHGTKAQAAWTGVQVRTLIVWQDTNSLSFLSLIFLSPCGYNNTATLNINCNTVQSVCEVIYPKLMNNFCSIDDIMIF